MKFKILIVFSYFFLFILPLKAEENKFEKNTELSVYTGMFDFSDNGKRSSLIGFQHQDEELNRDTFLGNLSPITGAMITADNASYFYTGVQANYKIGNYLGGFQIDATSMLLLKDLSYSQKIKAKLMADDRIDATGIIVSLGINNKLLVSGRVNSEEEKETINELCKELHPEGDFDNEILIVPPIEGWYPV